MIVFDLRCEPRHHVFEAWFGSSDDYQSQKDRGLVQCPLCGSSDIDKAVMAPRLGAKGNQRLTHAPATDEAVLSANPDMVKQMFAAVAAVQKQWLAQSEYVGEQFAEEARAIHVGEADKRPIYGRATQAQTESLIEDGIAVISLPFPVIERSEEN